jgi:Uma2 family endonuclease
MAHVSASPLGPLPIAPTEEAWRAMTAGERDSFLDRVLAALSDPRNAMSEGRPHKKAKTRALDLLGLHFNAMGRVVYLAEEMAVAYPGEEVFSPDVLAVVDVPQIDDDPRMAWVVADEGKGLDFVLEVLHRGDRKKDLVDNVERYARLGIPEYFVYDRMRQEILGHRLVGPGARRYQRILPQGGRHTSLVLGVDLAIQSGILRFFQGTAELFSSADLIGRLTGMVEELEAKAERASAEVEQAAAKVDRAIVGMRETVLAVLSARGIACPDDARARLMACDDLPTLQRWVARATVASSAAEALSPESEGP